MGRDDQLTVSQGVPLADATSAMTKALRRGQELEGLYWAQQIEQRFPWYLWRRLAVFAAEDVGLADPQAMQVVAATRQAYGESSKESRAPRPDSVLLGFVVLYLARSPKSREADDLVQSLLHLTKDDGWRPDVPDEALDLHTATGRARMTPDERLAHWLNEASRLVGEVGSLDWKLWLRRWAVRRGVLDHAEVEAEATGWDAEGRLRYGVDGYPTGTPRQVPLDLDPMWWES